MVMAVVVAGAVVVVTPVVLVRLLSPPLRPIRIVVVVPLVSTLWRLWLSPSGLPFIPLVIIVIEIGRAHV